MSSTTLSDAQVNSFLSIAFTAAFSDGAMDEREREQLHQLAKRLAGERFDAAALDRHTLAERPSLAAMVLPLDTPESRRQAYELAVAVCDADGAHGEREAAFLRDLASALGLPGGTAAKVVADAGAIASAAAPNRVSGSANAQAMQGRLVPDAAEIDKRILDASITNAALELLPETLASMAILPLQVRLVYKIGEAYGYELDQGHIKEFIAALGVGLTGQYLEQFGRKLLGGLLGSVLGGMGRAAGKQAASSGMAFATTWALGNIAKQYYAAGRTLDTAKLKAAFSPLVAQGQDMMTRYGGPIAEKARTIDVRNLPALIKAV